MRDTHRADRDRHAHARSRARLSGACALRLVAVLLSLACAACSDSSGTGAGGGAAGASPRIVSLSPAITRALVDVGLGHAIVARTPFCAAVDASVPVAGSSIDFDTEMLVSVRPTHVFLQMPAHGIDPALAQAADEHGWTLRAWRLDRVEDIAAMIRSFPMAVGGAAADDLREQANAVAQGVTRLLPGPEAIERANGPRLRTLLLVSADPMSAAGKETFLDDLLPGAGCTNAVSSRGYVTLSHEDLVRLSPDLIVLLRDNGAVSALELEELVLPNGAMQRQFGERFHVIVHGEVLIPSSSLIEVARELESISLHGGRRWR